MAPYSGQRRCVKHRICTAGLASPFTTQAFAQHAERAQSRFVRPGECPEHERDIFYRETLFNPFRCRYAFVQTMADSQTGVRALENHL